MNLVRVVLILSVAGIPLGLSAEPTANIEKTVEVYGSKTEASIAVRFAGEGITKPGIYHISPKADLFTLITSAGVSHLSNGWFQVSRRVDGYERSFGFRVNREKQPALTAFELLDDDFVYASVNMP